MGIFISAALPSLSSLTRSPHAHFLFYSWLLHQCLPVVSSGMFLPTQLCSLFIPLKFFLLYCQAFPRWDPNSGQPQHPYLGSFLLSLFLSFMTPAWASFTIIDRLYECLVTCKFIFFRPLFSLVFIERTFYRSIPLFLFLVVLLFPISVAQNLYIWVYNFTSFHLISILCAFISLLFLYHHFWIMLTSV